MPKFNVHLHSIPDDAKPENTMNATITKCCNHVKMQQIVFHHAVDCFDLNLIKRLCTNQRVSSYLVAIGRGNVLINVVGKLQL